MMTLIAIYDACVLYSNFLRDFLIRFAIRGQKNEHFRAKWTGRIHREWIRAVLRRKPGLREKLRRTCREMDRHVPGCRVRNYQRWERRLSLPDEDDRHVLAAALACVADFIVTFNLNDFPAETLRPFGVAAVTPDQFVLSFWDKGIVLETADEHRTVLRNPPMSPNKYLETFRRNGLPDTADALSADESFS